MKIALVSEHASPLAPPGAVDAGGQNVHVRELARALARRGHRVVVHTRRSCPDQPARVAMGDGVVVDHVGFGPPREMPKDALLPHVGQLTDELARRWQQDPPDVVHAHFWMSGLAAVEAAESPVLQTFHALGSVKRRWQGAADTSPEQRVDLERAVVARATRVIATCTDEVRELITLGARRDRVDVVPCGVDTTEFRPGRAVLGRVLVVGRLVPRKGVEHAIEAVARLPHHELLVAGGPAEGFAHDPEVRRLRALAGPRVRFLGQVPRSRMPALVASAESVLCLPWYEPFGIVPLEAMACGTPVVGAAVGGLLDTVVDGVTGHLVPPRDTTAAADALARIAQPAVRQAMSAAGRRRAVDRYDWTRVAEQTERSYLRALLGARTSEPAEVAG